MSALDQELLGAVLRFLRAVGTDADRRVLAPLYLQEMVYRVLQREQFARLLAIAAAEAATNPVSAVLDYVRAHLSEPLTVADMAEQVSLSPSAFAHLFRDVTGRSPYQFLKEMRLDQARELLVDGNLAVARVSKEVGYASVSHFISEFRGRFGVTPRAYGDMNAMNRELGSQRCRGDRPPAFSSGRLDLDPASGLDHRRMQNLTVSPASTATRSAVAVRGLRKSFGQQVVLDGIDLDVAEGTVFALLGPNGSGKTTTVRILSTLLRRRRRDRPGGRP